ncbi:Dual specificity mitogen-activated protein kinase kinase 7 [Fasciola gigantica]|uniref:mitogen-activated protein kinase kinase n=1 Tax=Fasciola gigantica TaxID=46835 RepID=A0A504YN98_FASGI|nr:Dual specificity mitogen-activated protein kinase kinase 7 [Fasciola gigantica]
MVQWLLNVLGAPPNVSLLLYIFLNLYWLVLAERTRSESPGSCSTVRPSDLGSSPAADVRCDLDAIQRMFQDCNGVLCFGHERIKAGKEDFNCEKVLAYGNCSEVRKMRHRKRRELVMAVKVMYLSSNSEEENKLIFSDLNVVTQTNQCPFIVTCYGILFTGVEFWICMELMPTCLGRLLRDLSDPFPEHVIGKVVVSIVSALDYLKQKHNVIHRDVKPSNMLLGYRGEVKLCDFGISGKLQDSITRSASLGCIRYMAPERLKKQEYDVRADVWSLGVSILELATGSFPYQDARTEFALMTKIMEEEAPTLPSGFSASLEFRVFVETCLQKRVSHRPKYTELKRSKFFVRHNVEPLNVLSWLQTLNLAHLRQSITSSALLDVVTGCVMPDPLEIHAGCTADQDRTCATTPTPESAHVYTNGSGNGNRPNSHGPIQTRGTSRPDAVNVPSVCASAGVHNRQQSGCAELANGVSKLKVEDFLSDQLLITCDQDRCASPRPSETSRNRASPFGSGPVIVNDDLHENLSKGGTSSPRDSIGRRPRNPLGKVFPFPDNLPTGSRYMCSADVHSGSSFSMLACNRLSPAACPYSLPRRIMEQGTDSNQWIECSLSSSRMTHRNSSQLPTLLPKATGQTNGNGTPKLSKPVKMGQTGSTNCKLKPVQDKSYTCSPEPRPIRQSTPQTRSASAGAQLRRSHARRWQSKPGFPLLREPQPNHDLRLANHATTWNHGSILQSSASAGHHAPQNYHHHYYYYFYQQSGVLPSVAPGPQRAMTPPLISHRSNSPLNETLGILPSPKHPSPVCRNGLNPLLSGRLAHRLYTHPLPRQNGFLHRSPRFDPHIQTGAATHPMNLPLSLAEQHHPCAVQTRPIPGNDPDATHSRDPVRNDLSRSSSRGPHRSSSQPANSHNWLSFETEL